MAIFKPPDANFEARVRTSFARQNAMATLNVEITAVNAGEIELKMPYSVAYPQWSFLPRLRLIQAGSVPVMQSR
jgi:hypothetical protein